MDTMTHLHVFMQTVKKGLDREVSEGSKHNDSLMAVMADIRDIRKKINYVSDITNSHRKCVEVLKKHGIDMFGAKIAEKNIQDFLEELPLTWEAVVKKMFQKKEEILPLQIASIDSLKSELDEFYLSIRKFRGDFRANAPFKSFDDSDEAFVKIESYSSQLDELVTRTKRFLELEELFELQHAIYPEIDETRIEIQYLKNIWNFKSSLQNRLNQWSMYLWKDVDTDNLESSTKKLRKQLKELGNSLM